MREVARELASLPPRSDVAIHLSGHGLATTMCGEYDCGSDSYHRSSAQLFDSVSTAIKKSVAHKGRLGVFHLYGDGGTDDDDPDDKVNSPIEALAKRKEQGFAHVVDIPYEFDSDSRDTLIILRQGYERPIPDWDRHLESYFRFEGMRVKIGNASFGWSLKTDALERVIVRAIEDFERLAEEHQH